MDEDSDFLLASASGDRSAHFVFRGNPHALVLCRVLRNERFRFRWRHHLIDDH
jgi:hypothetical protein